MFKDISRLKILSNGEWRIVGRKNTEETRVIIRLSENFGISPVMENFFEYDKFYRGQFIK